MSSRGSSPPPGPLPPYSPIPLSASQTSAASHFHARIAHLVSLTQSSSRDALARVLASLIPDIPNLPCAPFLQWVLGSCVHQGEQLSVTRAALVHHLECAMDQLSACLPTPSRVLYPALIASHTASLFRIKLFSLRDIILDPLVGVEYRKRALLFFARDPRFVYIIQKDPSLRPAIKLVLSDIELGRGIAAADRITSMIYTVDAMRKDMIKDETKGNEYAMIQRCAVVSQGRTKTRASRSLTMGMW